MTFIYEPESICVVERTTTPTWNQSVKGLKKIRLKIRRKKKEVRGTESESKTDANSNEDRRDRGS